jgi:uncharacterized membrane protein YphA (DoxX/SURF4 family)
MPSKSTDQAIPAASDATSDAADWRARLAPAWAFLRGPYPTLVSRAVVGGVFLLTGILKALDVPSFEHSIQAYQMVPAVLVPVMANGLPWLEIVVGAYVLAGLYRRWSALVVGALLVIFMIAMGQALARGLTLQCGCFGAALGGAALREEVNIGSILRDGVWLLLAAHLYFVSGIWTADGWLARRAGRRGGGAGREAVASGNRGAEGPAHESGAAINGRRAPARPSGRATTRARTKHHR